MANVDIIEPFWPDATTAGVQRWPRNHAIAPGAMDTVPTAAADYAGALVYTPGASGVADRLDVVLKNSADAYVVQPINPRRVPISAGASFLTLTESQSGGLIHCGVAEDFVLPTITAANIGLVYEFVVTATATSLTITAAEAQLLKGGVAISSTTVNEGDAFSADGTDDLVITMNGTTTGGIIGSWVKLWATSTTQWTVTGSLIGSGTITTPFS